MSKCKHVGDGHTPSRQEVEVKVTARKRLVKVQIVHVSGRRVFSVMSLDALV